jgi:hypothetical protein
MIYIEKYENQGSRQLSLSDRGAQQSCSRRQRTDILRGFRAFLPLDSVNLSPYVEEERIAATQKDGTAREAYFMTFALKRADGLPASAGALGHVLPCSIDSSLSVGSVAVRHFCEGSTK